MKNLLIALTLSASFASAQTQINYADGENRSTAINTSGTNDPTTLDLTSGTATQSGDISGSGGVIKDGKGLLVLDGTNTYTGNTSVVEGTLQMGSDDAVATGTHLDVSAGATFDLSGKTGTVGTLFGAGNLSLGFGGDLTVNTAGSGYFSGIISGMGGSLTKGGTGELALRGPNTYSGGTTLNQGILTAYHDGAFGTGLLTVNGGSLKVDDDRRFENNIRLNNDLNVDLVGSSSYDLVFVGDVDLGGETRVITVDRTNSGQNLYLGGPISDSTATSGVTLRGIPGSSGLNAAFFVMDGAESNTYTGLTMVEDGAVMVLEKANGATAIAGDLTNSGRGVAIHADEQIADTSTVNLRGGTNFNLLFDSTETIDTLTDDGPDNEIFYIGGGGSLYVREGSIQAEIRAGGVSQNVFGQKGNGTVTLLNPDSRLGLTTVDGGTLRIGVNVAEIGGGMRILSNGSTFSYGDGVTLSNSLELRADGNVEVLAGESASHSGIISEDATARTLAKTGDGTLTLTAANTYTGGTSVLYGTLLVNNTTGSGTGTGEVTVNSGSTLGGNGFIGGNVVVNTGATLAPGNSPGTLTIDGDLDLNGLTVIEIAGLSSFDQIDVGGEIDYGGDLFFDFSYVPSSLGTFDIFDFGSRTPLSEFANITFNNTNIEGNLNYDTGVLTLTAVPEPEMFGLLVGLLGLGFAVTRRRRG